MEQFTAVTTTGIYCRPGCGAQPLSSNTRAYDLAASAEVAGFRACHRCRPYRSSFPEYWTGPEIVCRGVRLILDGALDGGKERDLAWRLGVSGRHLRRLFNEHLGITPTELAQSTRAHFARRLLDDTDLTVTEIAFAAGFGSVRQLNRICQKIFHATPTELRAKRRKADRLTADGGLRLRLPYSGPFDWEAVIGYLATQAVPGVEKVEERLYRRTILVEGAPGVIEVTPGGDDHLLLWVHLPYWDGLIHLVSHVGRLFGLNQDIYRAAQTLGADPVLRNLLATRPGVRVPGAWDIFEIGVQAILGRGRSSPRTRSLIGDVVHKLGRPVPGLAPMGLTHAFPSASEVATANLKFLGIPAPREETIRAFATAVAEGPSWLDHSASLDIMLDQLGRIKGMSEGSANQIALRLGERDAFPSADRDLERAYRRLHPAAPPLATITDRWRPYRALAAMHLWMSVEMTETDTPAPLAAAAGSH